MHIKRTFQISYLGIPKGLVSLFMTKNCLQGVSLLIILTKPSTKGALLCIQLLDLLRSVGFHLKFADLTLLYCNIYSYSVFNDNYVSMVLEESLQGKKKDVGSINFSVAEIAHFANELVIRTNHLQQHIINHQILVPQH